MEQLFLFIVIIIKSILGLSFGCFLFYLFAIINTHYQTTDYWQELDSDFSTMRMNINGEMINLLYQIGRPDMSDGTYSEEKQKLWEEYYRKNKQYNELFKHHTDIIINKRRVE